VNDLPERRALRGGRAKSLDDLDERLWKASDSERSARAIEGLLRAGARPARMCRQELMFLTMDRHCWLMRVARTGNVEALAAGWSAILGRADLATPAKLATVAYEAAWRCQEEPLARWFERAWGEAKGSEELLAAVALQAATAGNDLMLAAAARAGGSGALDRPSGAWGRAPLIAAALSGSSQTLSKLLELGVDVERRDASGRTALLAAAHSGSADKVRMLARVGDPRAVDFEGVGLTQMRSGASGPLGLELDAALARGQALSLGEAALSSQADRGFPRRQAL
jgi:hypothetical protein